MLKLKVPKKIGKTLYNFEVEGANLHDVMMEKDKLSFQSVKECGLCKSDSLYIKAYITKEDEYEYVKIICSKCKASLTFGKVKNKKDTYFLRRNEDKTLAWVANTIKEEIVPKIDVSGAQEANQEDVAEDDIPF